MSLNAKSLVTSGVLLLGAFDANAQTTNQKNNPSGFYPLPGDKTGQVYQVDLDILESFKDGADAYVIELDKPSDLEPDSVTNYIRHLRRLGPSQEIMRYDLRSISSDDDSLKASEVVSKKVLYKDDSTNFVLVVEEMANPKTEMDRIQISGFNMETEEEFIRVRCMRPFDLGEDRGERKLFAYYDDIIAYLDERMEQHGLPALVEDIADFAKEAKASLASQRWHKMTRRSYNGPE
jgi:hypothetical protein